MSNSVATLVVQTELLSTQTPSSLSTFPSLLAQGEDEDVDGDKGGGEQQETETVVLTSVEMVPSATNVSQNAEYPFQCLDCGKSFKWSSRLAHHRRSHNNERPYRCNLCPKAFKGSSALLYHQRSHSGEKPYKCEDCGKAFKRSSLLQVHRSVHTGLRTFQCTYCPLTFKWSSHYQYHLRQHTGESPYPCDRCPKAFKNSSSLRRHKNVHLGVKPHVCVVCRKAFSQSTNLRQHMRIHTGERPYVCDECGRSFTHSSNLALHRNSHIEGKTKCSEKLGKEASCTNVEAVLEREDTADLRGVEMSISDMVELVGVQEGDVEQVFLSHHVPQSSSDAIQNVLRVAGSKHVQVSLEMSSGDTGTNAPLYSCGSCSEMFGTQAHLEEHQALHLHSLEPGNSCEVPSSGSLEAQGGGVSLMAPLLADFEEVVETTTVSENKQRTEIIGLGSIDDGNGPVQYDLLQSLTGSVNELPSDETVATVDSTTLSECAYCGKRFKNSSLLSRHVAQMHPLCPAQSRSQFSCSVCDRSFPILSSLLSHQLSHTEEQRLLAEAEAEIVCPSSLTLSLPLSSLPSGNQEAAKTEGGRENHVSLIPVTEEREKQDVKPSPRATGKIGRRNGGNKGSVTNSERPYHCSECGKSFKGSSGLRYHMRDHTGERPYRCTECGKSFKRSSLLSIHQRVHTGVRAFQCPYCPLTFKWSSHYQYHQRQHTGERPYVCQECGKSFKNTSCLRRHSQLHSGLRPHACSVCGKSFSQTSNLKQHERTHSGERPFQCAQCHKSFTHSSNLQLHLRTHSSRKDYKCHCCGKEFIMHSYLQRHLRTHSSGGPECMKEVGKVSKSGTGALEVPPASLTLNAAGGLSSLFSSDGKSTLMLSSSGLDIPPNTSQNYFMIQTNMGLQLIPLSNPVPMQPVRTPSPLPPQQPPPQNFLLLQCQSTNGNQPSLLLVPAASSPNALPTPSVPQPLNMVQTVPALPQILAPAQSQVTHFQPIQTQQRFILTSNSAPIMTGSTTAFAKPIIGSIGSTRSVRTRRGRKPKAKKSDPRVQETLYPLTDPNISTKLADSSVTPPVLSQHVVEVPTSTSPQNSRLLDAPSVSSKIGLATGIPPIADICISPDVSHNISETQKNSEPLPGGEHFVLCFEKKTEEQDKGVEMEVKVEMNEGSEEGSSYVLHFEREGDYREDGNEQRGEKSYILQFKAQQGIEDSVEPEKNEMVSLNLLQDWGTDGERLGDAEEGDQMKNKSFVLHFHTNPPSDDDIPPSSSYVDSPSEELGLSCHPDQALMPLSGQEVVFELGNEAKLDEETEGGGNVQMIALIEAEDGSSGTGGNFSHSGGVVGTEGEQMEGIFQLEGGEGIVIIEVSTSSLREKVEGVSLGLQHGDKEETLVPEMTGERKSLETLSRLSTEVNGSEEFNSG